MARRQIIQTAIALFAVKGIQAVSMEEIAAAAEISEKTVYAEFGSKEKLIEESLESEIKEVDTAILEAQTLSQSTLESLILLMCAGLKTVSNFCPIFYKDLSKYPGIYRRLAIFNLKFQDECTVYFQQCMEEGYFKSHENNERMASIYIEEITNMASKYQSAMIQTLLKGISTPKGIKELNRIKTVLEIKISKIIDNLLNRPPRDDIG